METPEIQITVYNKKERVTTTMYVKKLAENTFRMTDNDIFDCQLRKGAEFTTRINIEGNHEIVHITKESEFITKQFMLTPDLKTSDYRMLGEELIKHGGFWQVDFGSLATINIPKDFPYDINQVIKELDLKLVEVTDQ